LKFGNTVSTRVGIFDIKSIGIVMTQQSDSRSNSSTGHVAIVEDDESLRRAIARLLAAYSFEVRPYASAREFLASLEHSAPACLILDLQMNDMTGQELLHHLGGTKLRFPTIIATAHDEPGTRHRCKLAGAFAVLFKPLNLDELLQAIEAALSRDAVARDIGKVI
jgi:FixJ family two-component response regulator